MSTVGLPISRLINTTVNLAPTPPQAPSINSLLVLGTADVIDVVERMREYLSLDAVATDFLSTSDEYLSAVEWFGQTPQPPSILIGRWANTATSGRLVGAPLTAAEQLIANFTAITTGSFTITIDGTLKTVTALNFSAATNLNAVASIVTTALASAGTMTWNATYENFTIKSATTGTTSSVTFMSVGGAGTDVTPLFGMLSTSSGAYTVAGIVAETALSAVELFDGQFADQWYGLDVPAAVDADTLAIAAYIEGASVKHYFGVSTTEGGVIVSTDTTDIAYQLKQLKYNKTATQYSSTSKYAIAAYLGRILTTNWQANNSTITLMYKQEPGIVAEVLNGTQITALEAKNCNVFVAYNNNTAIIEPGMSASGQFTDTIIGLDWLSNEVQTALYSELYTSLTKVPQTDAGNHLLAVVIENVLIEAVNNGLIAPGQWNSGGFGALQQGDFLKTGYYVYAPPIATQPQNLRAARASVPFQIAVKMAGAIQTVDASILVNL